MSLLIAIEGLDASGKNTQAKRLAWRLNGIVFAFPRYDALPLGPVIRAHLLGQVALRKWDKDGADLYPIHAADATMFQSLMLADKCDASVEIRKMLADGRHVVCDRWIPSSRCYGRGDRIDPGWLDRMHALLPQADINIFINVSPEEALRRRPEARDRYERDRQKQALVRRNYEHLWAEHKGDPRWAVIDGEADVDTVEEHVWQAVQRVL